MTAPEDKMKIDFVFTTSQDPKVGQYDNNNGQDYHARVLIERADDDTYWEERAEERSKMIREQRTVEEEAKARFNKEREELKQVIKEQALESRRRALSRILFTEPSQLVADSLVKVFYNPNHTVLRGRQNVWIEGSWNRWSHPECLLPQKMTPSKTHTDYLEAQIRVPKDAWSANMVFSDSRKLQDGFYDSFGGLDYNIPVEGGSLTEPPLRVAHITIEMAPVAKVGGLGDVVTALSRAVEAEGHRVMVILPKYDCMNYSLVHNVTEEMGFDFGGTYVKCWRATVSEVNVMMLEPENGFFWVGTIYGRNDDASRFRWFSHAALEYLSKSNYNPDIIHCHDWSSGFAVPIFWEHYQVQMIAWPI